MNRTD